jgi:hypothetical protein
MSSHSLSLYPSIHDEPLCSVVSLSKPYTYQDVVAHPEWQFCMAEKNGALEHTSTWDIFPCPPFAILIMCKWVYKIKTRSDRSIEHYKARLVTCGFQQQYGRDHEETFVLLPIGPPFILLLQWPLFNDGLSLNLT